MAPIPATLVGRSFAVRSLAMLPAPFIFVSAGIYYAAGYFKRSRLFALVMSFIVVLYMGHTLIRYYIEYPVYAATWWGWENKAALDYAKVRENLYDNIFISDFYTGSTLAFAVYNQYDPLKYRSALESPVVLADNRHLIKLGKYYFGSLDLDSQRLSQNIIPPKSLYIGRPEEPDSQEKIVSPEDGRIIFKIFHTD